jgi:hypothetical protein
MPLVPFVLVLEQQYWDVVDIRSHFPGSHFLKRRLNGIDSCVFEYEYEYREAEYEKAEFSPTKIPEEPKNETS